MRRALGKSIPDSLVEAVIAKHASNHAIDLVRSALHSHKGNSYYQVILSNREIAGSFVEDPHKIEICYHRLVRSAPSEANLSFELATRKSGAEFAKFPEEFASSFEFMMTQANAPDDDYMDCVLSFLEARHPCSAIAHNESGVRQEIEACRDVRKPQEILLALKDPVLWERFVQDPQGVHADFRDLAPIFDRWRSFGYTYLSLAACPNLMEALRANKAHFVEVLNLCGGQAETEKLKEPVLSRYVYEYCSGNGSGALDKLNVSLFARSYRATELGRTLDDLHEEPSRRAKAIRNLSDHELIGLVCSDPALFFTSTNHALFDELSKRGGGSPNGALGRFVLEDSTLTTNLCYRALIFDRFSGKGGIFTEAQGARYLSYILAPTKAEHVDPVAFYELGNSLDRISSPLLRALLFSELEKACHSATDPIMREALACCCYRIHPRPGLLSHSQQARLEGLLKDGTFDPDSFISHGKLRVLQLFDREDTGDSHWIMSQRYFEDYYRRQGGLVTHRDKGKVSFEDANSEVVLFMGDSPLDNVKCLEGMLKENQSLIVTFRGHSFSLDSSVPPSAFGNLSRHVLFIPGSCGSAEAEASYISNNPKTSLQFITNSSTGRGQVTNAIVECLLGCKKPKVYSNILESNSAMFRKLGGDVSTLHAPDRSFGAILLRFLGYSGAVPMNIRGIYPEEGGGGGIIDEA